MSSMRSRATEGEKMKFRKGDELIDKVSTAWKVYKYGVISGPYFPAFGLNAEI